MSASFLLVWTREWCFKFSGDTGGVKHPVAQQLVASAMEADATDNTDGDPRLLPGTREPEEPSLSAWIRNFCSEAGGHTDEAGDTPRHAMKQPNPYWTLETPKANFIGLYTNIPEGGDVKEEQKAWLAGELKNAARDHAKALFVCLNHPAFSADAYHSGSPSMKELLDTPVQVSGAHPDIVFTAHVHNYQRFTRAISDQQYTYVVAGAGGYWHLHSMAKFKGAKVTPPFRQKDDVILENYVDDTHGFMRVEIDDDLITLRYFAVPRPHEPPETPPRVADLFQLRFKRQQARPLSVARGIGWTGVAKPRH